MGPGQVCPGGLGLSCCSWNNLEQHGSTSKNKGLEVRSVSAPEMIHASWKQLFLLQISDISSLIKMKVLRGQRVFKLGLHVIPGWP